MKFIMMYHDEKIAAIEIDKDRLKEGEKFVIEYKTYNDMLLPFAIKQAITERKLEEFEAWFKHRIIPSYRKNIGLLAKELKSYPAAWTVKAHGASLTDGYWIRKEREKVTWKEVSCFDKKFDYSIGNLTFGLTSGRYNYNTPDITTAGAMPKTWRFKDGRTYLIKYGSAPDYLEPYNEKLATEILKRVCPVPFVTYDLVLRVEFYSKLISLLWAVVLMISIHSYQNYIPIYPGYTTQLTITSSSYLVFSFIVNYMAVLATRQRAVVRRIQRLAYVDPVVHLPNVRALNRALRDAPWSALCYLRIPGMEMLVKNYGIMLRIQYKQKLSHWLSPLLEPGEDVYQLSGNDLALRLNTESHQERITALDSHLKQFRFFWDGMPMQPQIGVSYCYVRSPVNHIYLLLGELNTVAELSIVTNTPENMQRRGAMYLQRELKDKVVMMNRLQQALEHNHFFLMAQPITGMRGDVYHEILLRMKGENDELISPDSFLPVAHEFGLSSSIDMWVLEHTLQFMAENRAKMPAHRFAINLSPTSVCQARFPVEVSQLLAKYQIEAWQLIFEVTESNALTNVKQAQITLQHLQELGCQIAIDDFDTGYASYARLKNVNADLLKIDGSFIRNIVSNSLDYQIVASICHLARMKKMRVVAEYVENEEIREAVLSLGIDYMQGYLIGKPQPLIDTLNEIEPIRESA